MKTEQNERGAPEGDAPKNADQIAIPIGFSDTAAGRSNQEERAVYLFAREREIVALAGLVCWSSEKVGKRRPTLEDVRTASRDIEYHCSVGVGDGYPESVAMVAGHLPCGRRHNEALAWSLNFLDALGDWRAVLAEEAGR